MNILSTIIFLIYFLFISIVPGLYLSLFITKNNTNFTLVDRVLLSFIISPFMLLPLSFIEDVVGIPQVPFILIVNILIITFTNIYLIRQKSSLLQVVSLRKIRIDRIKKFIYLLFLGSLVFKLLPTLGSLVPLLHDPISHSEWLKTLYTTHHTTTQNSYPQGLEYYLNYFVSFFPFSYPKAILDATYYFVALFPVSMFYLGLLLTKGDFKYTSKYILPLLLFVFASVLSVPNDLYYTAGKNSMIMSFSIVPLALYLIHTLKKRIDYIILPILISSIFIVHYPTGMVLVVLFYIKVLMNHLDFQKKKILKDRKILINTFIAVLISICLSLFFLIDILTIVQNHPPSNPMADLNLQNSIKSMGVRYYLYKDFAKYLVSTFGIFIMVLFTAGLSTLLFCNKKEEDETVKKFILFNIFTYTVLYVLLFLILILPNKQVFGLFYSMEIRFFFLFVLISLVAWFISSITITFLNKFKKKELYSFTIILIFASFFFFGYKGYVLATKKHKALEAVTNKDVEAFQFINKDENIQKDNKKILIQIARSGDVVMGTDGGAWIPSFTNKSVEVDFADFVNPKSYDVFDVYIKLSKNPNDPQQIKKAYCDLNIGYIYFGSKPVFADNMSEEPFRKSGFYKEVFNNDGSSMFKINSLSCD